MEKPWCGEIEGQLETSETSFSRLLMDGSRWLGFGRDDDMWAAEGRGDQDVTLEGWLGDRVEVRR